MCMQKLLSIANWRKLKIKIQQTPREHTPLLSRYSTRLESINFLVTARLDVSIAPWHVRGKTLFLPRCEPWNAWAAKALNMQPFILKQTANKSDVNYMFF
jgi:hypothetical protein